MMMKRNNPLNHLLSDIVGIIFIFLCTFVHKDSENFDLLSCGQER